MSVYVNRCISIYVIYSFLREGRGEQEGGKSTHLFYVALLLVILSLAFLPTPKTCEAPLAPRPKPRALMLQGNSAAGL